MALVNCPECEKLVSSTAIICPNCGFGVKKHFDDIESAILKEQQLKELSAKRERAIQKAKIIIPICTVVFFSIVALCANNHILSKRYLFENETSMKGFVKGHWVEYSKYSDNAYSSLYIDKDILEYKSYSTDWSYADPIEYNPKRGFFTSGNKKYIISKDKTIICDNDVYETTYKSPDDKQSFVSSLSVELSKVEQGTKSILCTGNVTNNGDMTYEFVEIKCDFLDKDDNVISSETRILHSGESNDYDSSLDAGESMPFEIYYFGEHQSKIKSAKVSVIKYRNYTEID